MVARLRLGLPHCMRSRLFDDLSTMQRPCEGQTLMDGSRDNPHHHVLLWRPLHPLPAAVLTKARRVVPLNIIQHACDRAVVHHDAHHRVSAAALSPRAPRCHYRPHNVHHAYPFRPGRLLDAHERPGHREPPC